MRLRPAQQQAAARHPTSGVCVCATLICGRAAGQIFANAKHRERGVNDPAAPAGLCCCLTRVCVCGADTPPHHLAPSAHLGGGGGGQSAKAEADSPHCALYVLFKHSALRHRTCISLEIAFLSASHARIFVCKCGAQPKRIARSRSRAQSRIQLSVLSVSLAYRVTRAPINRTGAHRQSI